MNKIKISNPKIILIDFLESPPNSTSNNMLEISDSGANIHLEKQGTTTIVPIMISN